MKKNLQIIPKFIKAKLETIDAEEILIASTVALNENEILGKPHATLGIQLTPDGLRFKSAFIPNSTIGKYCKRNQLGREIILKQLPKIKKSFYLGDRPIYGDWSKGSFPLYAKRLVYQRKKETPKRYELGVQFLKEETKVEERYFIFKVFITTTLNRSSESFNEDLLYQLNLLQENIGKVGIFPADVKDEELLKIKTIEWEIFPPGERESDLNKIIGRLRKVSPENLKNLREKYDFLTSLNPEELIVGLSGLRGYFGAKFSENLVVFDNINYGNAIYVLYGDWQKLSKLSRTQILSRPEEEYDRIEHRIGWKTKLSTLINRKIA